MYVKGLSWRCLAAFFDCGTLTDISFTLFSLLISSIISVLPTYPGILADKLSKGW